MEESYVYDKHQKNINKSDKLYERLYQSSFFKTAICFGFFNSNVGEFSEGE